MSPETGKTTTVQTSTRPLRERFLLLQKELEARLAANRSIEHGGEMGAATEEGWRSMLGDYLPKRYCVAKAFVIDSDGNRSEQIDLVIHDQQYSPFLFKQDGALFIPAESVYAVFEIKQHLTREDVEAAVQKAASVRKLHRTSIEITHAGGKFPARPPIDILAGLLCFDSRWRPAFGQPFLSAITKDREKGRLDFCCALRRGSVEVDHSSAEPRLMRSAPDAALIFFFLRLLERLQGVGTVPAIDLRRYGVSLGEDSAETGKSNEEGR